MKNSFIKVKCKDCSNEMIVFRRATSLVKCNVCGATIATPTGGIAKIEGVISELE
jgi:small subunit ribosomal protein S27e